MAKGYKQAVHRRGNPEGLYNQSYINQKSKIALYTCEAGKRVGSWIILCVDRDMRKWKSLYISGGFWVHVALPDSKLGIFSQI